MLEAHGLSMQLADGRWLFKNTDIMLNKGDVLVLRGPSGAGFVYTLASFFLHVSVVPYDLCAGLTDFTNCSKTTLLKCLAELVPYTSGSIKLNGKTPSEYGIPNWRSKVMYVPQRPAVHAGTPLDFFNVVKNFASQKNKTTLGDPVCNPVA